MRVKYYDTCEEDYTYDIVFNVTRSETKEIHVRVGRFAASYQCVI